MEEQSSGELASADPPTGAQDAGLQEPRISPTISLDPRSCLQHLQRPTSSDFSVDAPRLPCHGDGHLACGGRLKGLTVDEKPAITVHEPDPALRLAPQNVQLMPEYHVLGFQPALRLEGRSHDGQDEAEQREHCELTAGDSSSQSMRIR